MYFIIYKKNNRFEKLVFPNSILWNEMIAKVQGIIVEIFKNDLLELKHFDEYFNASYRKESKKHENQARRYNKVQL